MTLAPVPTLASMEDDEFDRIADLPDNGARQKETYARFGLAAYHAQVFETGMVNLIAVAEAYASRSGTPMTAADIDALNADLFGYTSGRLVNRLAEIIPAQPDLLDSCRRAVQERNRLMHHFFRDHDKDAMTTVGMQRMVDDADAVRLLFQEADRATTAITHGIFAKVGITEDVIRGEFERMLAEARERDEEDNARD